MLRPFVACSWDRTGPRAQKANLMGHVSEGTLGSYRRRGPLHRAGADDARARPVLGAVRDRPQDSLRSDRGYRPRPARCVDGAGRQRSDRCRRWHVHHGRLAGSNSPAWSVAPPQSVSAACGLFAQRTASANPPEPRAGSADARRSTGCSDTLLGSVADNGVCRGTGWERPTTPTT